SRQIGQSGASLMLKQREQKTTCSRTETSAVARGRASASGALSRWKGGRWAVFGPIPGRRLNASISLATGSMSGLATASGLQSRQAPGAAARGQLFPLPQARIETQ